MIFGSEPEWLSELVNKDGGARLCEVTVLKEDVNDIRYELKDAGAESVIFPGLDGLGREIEQRWADRLQ